MENKQQGNQVLSAIEQSIKSALSLFNYDFGGNQSLQSIEDDPIISIYGPAGVKQENSQISEEVSKSFNPPPTTPNISKVNEQSDNKPKFFPSSPPTRHSPTRRNSFSHESAVLPQLESPIQNTIDEMQRVLNARGDGFPQITGPSPEDILNLYSQDLGISLSSNSSPRGDTFRPQNDNEHKKEKNYKKDKEESKRVKPSKIKINSEKKVDSKKRKKSNLEIIDPKEAKLKELMKIYVGSNTIKEPIYESTINSKSLSSRKNSLKKLKQENDLYKTSSTALSKKSKRNKTKCLSRSDIEFDVDFPGLEKSSRLSTKRKSKQRRSLGDMKVPKKASIKRSNQNYSNEFQLNKENVHRDRKISSNNITNYPSRKFSYNNNKRQTQSKKYIAYDDTLYHPGKSFSDENDRLKIDDKGILSAIPNNKQIVGVKLKSYSSDPQNTNSYTQPSKKSHLTGNVIDLDNLDTKTSSEDANLNKNLLFPEGAIHNAYPRATENQEVHSNLLNHDRSKSNDKGVLSAIANNKQNIGAKSKSYSSDIKNIKRHTQPRKKSQLYDSERELETLGKKLSSEEGKLNKTVLFSESAIRNANATGNQEMYINSVNYDPFNEDYPGESENQHYALPTQSSRSKEVERFLNGHCLPFVIGKSTNKSHNLWVNIQEALWLIKQKVPQLTETPRSVVNDWAESERPLSVLSKLTTKSVKRPHQCPAIMSDSLYAIPEASTELDDVTVKTWEDHPECIKANLDPNYVRSRCSCSSQPVMSYKKVLHEIFGKSSAGAFEMPLDVGGTKEDLALEQGDSYTAELRKALLSFTQEFEDMNNTYEALLKDPDANQEELKLLEKKLENKEEEIKEIILRFNEVKEFNERVRLEGTRSRPVCYNLETFKSTTSIRLAQTLHRVQKFKESLKSKPSMPRQSNALGYY